MLLLMLLMVVVMVVSFDSSGGGLNLGGSRGRRRPGSLSGGRRGEVGLLLAGVEHHRRGGGRGGVLLDRVHGGGRARVLQVMLARVVVVMHVGRREVLELVVVMRVMGSHCRGATVVSSHHFWNIGSSCAAESHSPGLTRSCQHPLLRVMLTATRLQHSGSRNLSKTYRKQIWALNDPTAATSNLWRQNPFSCASLS